MSGFFNKFPTISYNGSFAKNILSRVNFNNLSRKNITQYYPYTMSEYERVDNLAYDYYSDPDYAWLIMLANQIVDPYYDMVISDDDFNSLMVKKYGSLFAAQTTIYGFKTSWESDDRILDQAAYDSLPVQVKKYWNNVASYNNITYSYVRKQEDLYATTNRIVLIPYTPGIGSFVIGETISQPYNASLTSTAVITNIDTVNHVLTVKHYIGAFIAGPTVTGSTSGATATLAANIIDDIIANGGNNLQRNFTADEDIYWTPITVYDYEWQKNNDKRNIVLIDKTKSNDIANQVKKLLNP